MHIFSYPEVKTEHQEQLQERAALFQNAEGISSGDSWEALSSQIDSFGAAYENHIGMITVSGRTGQ